jgi:hypothetical protein
MQNSIRLPKCNVKNCCLLEAPEDYRFWLFKTKKKKGGHFFSFGEEPSEFKTSETRFNLGEEKQAPLSVGQRKAFQLEGHTQQEMRDSLHFSKGAIKLTTSPLEILRSNSREQEKRSIFPLDLQGPSLPHTFRKT